MIEHCAKEAEANLNILEQLQRLHQLRPSVSEVWPITGFVMTEVDEENHGLVRRSARSSNRIKKRRTAAKP